MSCYLCRTCGTQYAESQEPPATCRICTDERQYVGLDGQQWTTHDQLKEAHEVRLEVDGDLLGVGITPPFGIPQRALHLRTDAGNILWECTSLVTDQAVEQLGERGGIDLIVISHPHFYSSLIEWSDAFGGIPVMLHEADRNWISRPSSQIELWGGEVNQLSPTVNLYRCPGHFPGSTVLHWTAAPHGRAVLLAGDALHVAQDRRHVSFMYSVPNYIPSHPGNVRQIRRQLDGLDIDDLYGFTWGLNIIGGARAAVDESFDRYLRAIGQPMEGAAGIST